MKRSNGCAVALTIVALGCACLALIGGAVATVNKADPHMQQAVVNAFLTLIIVVLLVAAVRLRSKK
jgi:hypothetical protein